MSQESIPEDHLATVPLNHPQSVVGEVVPELIFTTNVSENGRPFRSFREIESIRLHRNMLLSRDIVRLDLPVKGGSRDDRHQGIKELAACMRKTFPGRPVIPSIGLYRGTHLDIEVTNSKVTVQEVIDNVTKWQYRGKFLGPAKYVGQSLNREETVICVHDVAAPDVEAFCQQSAEVFNEMGAVYDNIEIFVKDGWKMLKVVEGIRRYDGELVFLVEARWRDARPVNEWGHKQKVGVQGSESTPSENRAGSKLPPVMDEVAAVWPGYLFWRRHPRVKYPLSFRNRFPYCPRPKCQSTICDPTNRHQNGECVHTKCKKCGGAHPTHTCSVSSKRGTEDGSVSTDRVKSKKQKVPQQDINLPNSEKTGSATTARTSISSASCATSREAVKSSGVMQSIDDKIPRNEASEPKTKDPDELMDKGD